MDHELFLKRLNELAEIKTISVPKTGNFREATEPDTIFRHGEEFDITVDNNPTLNYQVKRLKPIIKDCEDCGKSAVKDRIVSRKLYAFPSVHWRESCSHCRLTRHPETDEFEVGNNIVNAFFTAYYKKKNK